MKEIPLTQGKVALVDDEDYEILMKYKWYAHHGFNTFYAYTNSRSPNSGKSLLMHLMLLPPVASYETDHINGNGCDNRRENLRYVTRRQNCQNYHITKTSKFPGVSWEKRRLKWRSHIQVNGKDKHIGEFISEIDAACAYQVACKYLFG